MAVVEIEGARGSTRGIRQQFQRLAAKLEPLFEAAGIEEPDDALPTSFPKELNVEIRETLGSRNFQKLEEANEAVNNDPAALSGPTDSARTTGQTTLRSNRDDRRSANRFFRPYTPASQA